jgi:hypothetical protein
MPHYSLMAKPSSAERLTEDKLIKYADCAQGKKRKKRTRQLKSEDLTDSIPVRITRRSTIKGYRGTKVWVPATNAGILHSNLILGELLKQNIVACLENNLINKNGYIKPSEILDLTRAGDLAAKISQSACGMGTTKLPDCSTKERSLLSKYFKAVKEVTEDIEKEFSDAEFDAKLKHVEEANENIQEFNDILEKRADEENKPTKVKVRPKEPDFVIDAETDEDTTEKQ